MYQNTAALRKQFSMLDSFGEHFSLYRIFGNDGYIHIPRGVCPVGGSDNIVDGIPVDIVSKVVPRNAEQARIISESRSLLSDLRSFVLQASTGFGKCLGRGTHVLKYDGNAIPVELIRQGDKLMGPDSKPRIVSSVVRGNGPLYRITPRKGQPFVCNDVHILSLKLTARWGDFKAGDIVDIALNDYINLPKSVKHIMKWWRTGVNFPNGKDLPISPYFVGLMLGDGCMSYTNFNLTTADREIVSWVEDYALTWGVGTRVDGLIDNAASVYHFRTDRGKSNNLRSAFSDLGLLGLGSGNKYIPTIYSRASMNDRLSILAGLLDSDGHLVKQTVFEFSSKSKELAKDVQFVAGSCGFQVSFKSKNVNGTWYYSVFISGFTERIPTIIPRKKASPRRQKKDPLCCGFIVEGIGNGDYFGFLIDGDRRFLLGDFTVTHNTVVGVDLIAHTGRKTLIVVNKADIYDQWHEALVKFLGLDPSEIGRIQGDICSVKGKKVVIAFLQSVSKRDRYPTWVYHEFGFILVDEVHNIGADKFGEVAWLFPARLRMGMSATPYRRDGKDISFHCHIGPVLVKSDILPMIPKVLIFRTGCQLPLVNVFDPEYGKWVKKPMRVQPGRPGAMIKALAMMDDRNRLICDLVVKAYKSGRSIIVFSDSRARHLPTLEGMLLALGVPGHDMSYYVGGMNKAQREVAKTKRVILATYKMVSEATDIPWLDTCILCTPRVDVAQIVGRILREYPDKREPIVFDLVDNNNVLRNYASVRKGWYTKIGATIKDM